MYFRTKSDQINAKLDNGILTVNFPKSSSDTQPKRIKITWIRGGNIPQKIQKLFIDTSIFHKL